VQENKLKLELRNVKSELEQERDLSRCVICFDNRREMMYGDILDNISFQPCGHFVACSQCSTILKECPMCRKVIVDRGRVFM